MSFHNFFVINSLKDIKSPTEKQNLTCKFENFFFHQNVIHKIQENLKSYLGMKFLSKSLCLEAFCKYPAIFQAVMT